MCVRPLDVAGVTGPEIMKVQYGFRVLKVVTSGFSVFHGLKIGTS